MASKRKWKRILVVVVVVAVLLVLWSWWRSRPAQDEAKAAGLTKAYFRQDPHEADYFHEMDGGGQEGGGPFTPAEIRGRNTWMVWTGGDEAFWDWLANNSFGTFDLLKSLSSYPCSPEQAARAQQYEQETGAASPGKAGGYGKASYGQGGSSGADNYRWDKYYDGKSGVCSKAMWPPDPGKATYRNYSRDTRFCYQGLINEPGFTKATTPDEYGLCLDRRAGSQDPFDPKIYGRPTGVLGLRLYPNPAFDEKAKAKWKEAMQRDAFYLDPKFYSDRKLIRPYRVGMACSFCHVSPHPLHPPADPESPRMSELSGIIGAQYFWFGRVFGPNVTTDNFVWHLLGSQRPGAVDTSFIPADNLVNPRALNAIFNVRERLDNGRQRAIETSTGGARRLPEVATWKPSYTFGVPHILWDGADSVGIDAALTRVYINIGEYHQEWIRHINPIVGLGKQSPITVKAAQQNSTYWNSTQERAKDMAAYLIRAGYPMHLASLPEGQTYLKADPATLQRGKVVFAENCARCHSSKLPEQPATAGVPRFGDPDCIGKRYAECWNNYWNWTETPDFKARMTRIVTDPQFLDGNYLSNDARIPVTQLGTEICSAMASNAIAGHVWDNFSSQNYKDLPSVGAVKLHDPIQNKDLLWKTPGGGRGYQRVPSLISIWATAPFLHNNEVGTFTGDPSVAGRMLAFDDAIHKLLSPETRGQLYHRTYGTTYVTVEASALPWYQSAGAKLVGLAKDGVVRVGPIPDGTPVNLIGNINAGGNDPKVGLWTLGATGWSFLRKGPTKELEPDLIKVSACPDFLVDRGHEFGSQLSSQDKEALIEFLKTF